MTSWLIRCIPSPFLETYLEPPLPSSHIALYKRIEMDLLTSAICPSALFRGLSEIKIFIKRKVARKNNSNHDDNIIKSMYIPDTLPA